MKMRIFPIPITALLGLPALGTAFFLPPPSDTKLLPVFREAEVGILIEDPKSTVVSGSHTVVTLPCTGCVWHKDVAGEQGVAFAQGLESELLFDITIPAATPNILLINNRPVVPFSSLHGLSALQVPASASAKEVFTFSHPFRPLNLDYDLLVTGTINLDKPDKRNIIVKLRITSVDGVHNDLIPELEVLVVEDMKTRTLEIIGSHINRLEGLGHKQGLGDEVACQGISCVMMKLKNRLDRIRNRHGNGKKGGCGGRRKEAHALPKYHVPSQRGGPGHHGPNHHGHHGHHGHHQGGHPWFALIVHVFIPIVFGIIAGVGVTIIGLIVSQCAIKVWKVIKARSNSGRVEAVEEDKGMLKVYVDKDQEDELLAYVKQGVEM